MEQPLGSRYRVGELLGRGGMGSVHRGRDGDGRPYAIKLLRPELASDPEIVTRFVRERTVLTGISDPHLVAVRDLVIEGETLAIVMDLVDGPDLREALTAAGVFAPAEVARIGAGVAAGLAAAHEHGVLHRDVKPENVMFDSSTVPPTVRLADFGIARLIGDTQVSRVTGLIGTPNYLPPEVYAGEPAVPAGDLYALAVLLYELSCGVPPFVGDMVAVMAGHISVIPGRPPGIPDPLWDLMAQLLAKDPSARPGGATEICEILTALAPALADAPSAPRCERPPPGIPVPGSPWSGAVLTEGAQPDRTAPRAARVIGGRKFGRVAIPILAVGIAAAAGAGATWLSLERPTGAGAGPPPTVICDPTVISKGCGQKLEIERVQARLVELCYFERNDSAQIDGDFGAGTESAVRRFQVANGLEPDGKVSSRTGFLLLGESAKPSCATSTAVPAPP